MTDKVIAGGPTDHCVQGVKHSGDPLGSTETLAGVETYVVKPSADSVGGYDKIVLFFADVYGPMFINNKLLQDYFATQGFLVVGVDYFEGDPIYFHSGDKTWDQDDWFARKTQRAKEIVPVWIEAVKEKYGKSGTKYTAVGYCFGAPHVMDQGATDLLVAGAIAHPAFLNEEHFQNVKAPLLLSCSEIDHTFPVDKRRRAEDILVERKASYFFQVFSGVKHGFAIRGDPTVDQERWAKEESARGIAAWFERFSK